MLDQSIVEEAFADALSRSHPDYSDVLTAALEHLGFSAEPNGAGGYAGWGSPVSQEQLLKAMNEITPIATVR